MSKHTTGKEILDTYRLQELDLFNLVSEGKLQPYDRFGEKLLDPILQSLDAEIKRVETEIHAIKQNVPETISTGFVGTLNQHEIVLKEPLVRLHGLKLFRDSWIKKKRGTWQGLKLQKKSEALVQFDTLKESLFLGSEVKQVLGEPKEEKHPAKAQMMYKHAAKHHNHAMPCYR